LQAVPHATRRICRYAGVSKTSWYRSLQPKAARTQSRFNQKASDTPIVELIKSYRELKFFNNEGGYRKLGLYLRRDYGLVINHKKMHRICKAHGLGLPKKRGQKQRLRRVSSNRQVTGPDQLWQFDIKYGYIPGENRYFFICGFIDVFTRKVVDYHIGRRCTAEDMLVTLRRALRARDITDTHHLIIRSDNGPQMSSRKFEMELMGLPCDHEFIPIATPNKNAYIESFFSTLECALLAKSYFMNFAEAYKAVIDFIEFYNVKRIHGSIKMSPHEFETSWQTIPQMTDYSVPA
jgi:putative transposase